MVETEELSNQENFPKTFETGIVDDITEITTKKNNKNKNNKHLEISLTDENNKKHTKPKKTRLTKTISSL